LGKSVQVKAIIRGMVQGVGYRWFATREAMRFDVTGYVANLPGGDVEVVAEGEEGMVKEYLKTLKAGPPYSRVTSMETREGEYTGQFSNFGVRYY
jgi:acylphosphatase